MPAGFRRHLVGKTPKNAGYCNYYYSFITHKSSTKNSKYIHTSKQNVQVAIEEKK